MYEPVRLSRIQEGETLFIVAEGKYSLAEVQAAISAGLKESTSIRDCCLHMDIRRSEAVFSSDELRSFAKFLASLPIPIAKRAAWVVSADLRFGLARMLSAFAEKEGLELRVFRDTVEARKWLGSTERVLACGNVYGE